MESSTAALIHNVFFQQYMDDTFTAIREKLQDHYPPEQLSRMDSSRTISLLQVRRCIRTSIALSDCLQETRIVRKILMDALPRR